MCVCVCVCVCVFVCTYVLSCVWLFVIRWTVAHQAPLSMGFSRQECWSGLPCPPPGDLPDPGIKPASLTSPALADRFFTTGATWEVHKKKIDMEIYTRRKKGLLELGESGNASSKEMTFKFAFKGWTLVRQAEDRERAQGGKGWQISVAEVLSMCPEDWSQRSQQTSILEGHLCKPEELSCHQGGRR